MTAIKTFLALSCVGFIASAPTYAADPVDAPAAETDTPDAQQSDNDGETVVVNGERVRKNPKQVAPLVDTPRSIINLTSEVIQQTGSATLADALRTVPGITFGAAEGGNPVGDRPFIRGFDSQGSTYVDGVRDFAAQSREVFAVDTVQVVRGSDSTLGGRGSAGGSINIVTKQPTDVDIYAGTVSYGTDDYKRVTIDVNKRLSDLVAVRIQGVAHNQDFAGRDAIFNKRWGIAPSITIGMNSPTRLTLSYYHLDTEELPDSGIPYLYNVANSPLGTTIVEPAIGTVTTIAGVTGRVDRDTFYGLKNRDFRDTTTDQITLRAEHDFGAVTIRNTSRYNHNDQAYIYTQPDDQQGNVFGTNAAVPATAGGLVWRRANTRYGYAESLVNQTDLFGEFKTGGITHNFALGAEFAWEKARRGVFVTRGFLNATGAELLSQGSTITPRCTPAAIARFYCTSLFTPNPADPYVNYENDTSTVVAPMVRNLPIAETQNDANTRSFYGFDSIALTRSLILNLGARYDRYHSRIRPGQAVTATFVPELARTDDLFNYQAGLIFKPTGETSVYASYATSSTPPNSLLGEGLEGNALPTALNAANVTILDGLKPERTKSYEVGAKAALMDNRLNLGLAMFQTDTDNLRTIGPNNMVEFTSERRIRGLELTVTGTILPDWTVIGGYTYLDAEIVDGGNTAFTAPAVGAQPAKIVLGPSVNTGRQATQTAKHSVSAWTNATFFDRLSLGGGAFYVSRVYGGYADNRTATQTAAGVVTLNPATKINLRSIPGYWRFDARAGFKFTDKIELSVNVQNLTDKTYFTQAYTAHYATIAPGRSAFASLSFRY
ncbi:MAG: TonB-dependent receptor [Pseudomonadota bacterium]